MGTVNYGSSQEFYQARIEPFLGWLLGKGFSVSIPNGYPQYPDDNAIVFTKGNVDIVVWFSAWCVFGISISPKGKCQYELLSTVLSRRTGKRSPQRQALSDLDMTNMSQGLATYLPEIINGEFVRK